MTTHHHSVSGKQTSDTNVAIPDLGPLTTRVTALESALAALTKRVDALEGTPTPPPVGLIPNIPSSIDGTGTNDVTVALTSWLQFLPSGATAIFGNGATYRTDRQVHL